MDEPEGFFPERKLLAYRRWLRLRTPSPEAASRQNRYPWWVLVICLSPSYFPFWMVMYALPAPGGAWPPILIFGSYCLVACALIVAVLGIVFGTYRGLRTQKLLADGD